MFGLLGDIVKTADTVTRVATEPLRILVKAVNATLEPVADAFTEAAESVDELTGRD